MLLATVRRLQAEACFHQQAVPSTKDAMAGERMVSICSQNMLPMEAQAAEQSRLWSLPVLYAPVLPEVTLSPFGISCCSGASE